MTLKVIKTNKVKPGKSLTNSQSVYAAMRFLEKKDREHFYVLHLNSHFQIIGKELISIGSLTQSTIHPREVFKGAILNNSAAIICVHNHPSGNPEPSQDDIKITKQLKQVGDMIGIQLLDHMIIADKSSISLLYNEKEISEPNQVRDGNDIDRVSQEKKLDGEILDELYEARSKVSLLSETLNYFFSDSYPHQQPPELAREGVHVVISSIEDKLEYVQKKVDDYFGIIDKKDIKKKENEIKKFIISSTNEKREIHDKSIEPLMRVNIKLKKKDRLDKTEIAELSQILKGVVINGLRFIGVAEIALEECYKTSEKFIVRKKG